MKVIDTWHPSLSELELYRASTLLDVLEVEDKDKLQRKFFTHEYLCLGEVLLNRHYSSTLSFDRLIDCGLFRIYPDLETAPGDRVWLYKTVMRVRFGPQFDHEWLLSIRNFRVMRGLVDIIRGENTYLAFAIALLALRKHNLAEENVLKFLAHVLSS